MTLRFRFDGARSTADQNELDIGSTDLDVITRHIDPDIVAGGTTGVGAGDLLLHDGEAEDLGVGVGDLVELEFPGGELASLEVAAIFSDATVLGTWVIDHADWDRYLTGDQDQFISAITAEGYTAAQAPGSPGIGYH